MLSTIRTLVQEAVGVDAFSLVRLNQAARELYDGYNLLHSLREATVDLEDSDYKLVALPWFVGRIMAVRPAAAQQRIYVQSVFNKYVTEPWRDQWMFEYVGIRPIKCEILNSAPVTVTLPAADDTAFVITVLGSNEDSGFVRDEITVPVGTTSVTGTQRFRNIDKLTQDVRHKYDAIISDIDGRELARLPNHLTEAPYHIIRLTDNRVNNSREFVYVDVLYKPPFKPFVGDTDVFQCGEIYNMAIVYKYLANLYLEDEKRLIANTRLCEAQIALVAKTDTQSHAAVDLWAAEAPRAITGCYMSNFRE